MTALREPPVSAGDLPPTPAAYIKAAREVVAGEGQGLRTLRVAVLSTVSAQVLEPFLVVAGAARGLRIAPWFAPFGQLEEQALESQSALYAGRPEAVVVLARSEELAPAFHERFFVGNGDGLRPLKVAGDRLRALAGAVRQRTEAPIFLANFAAPAWLAAGVADAGLTPSQAACVQEVNSSLAVGCQAIADAFVFDYARVVLEQGLRAWGDPRLFALARNPWSVAAQIGLGKGLARMLRAALIPPAKCLVVDLDNTLWGGVLGEEGFGGIALGDEYPGNAYKSFQKYLRNLRDRGVLLAIASRNNEAEVAEVFSRHGDCVLRREDFAAVRINWQEKSANLRELAAELNLGLDALAFFDDSAFEREEVRRRLPMVTVFETPASPLQFIETIEESGAFDQLRFLPEDRHRADLYRTQAVREKASAAAGSTGEFLASLGLVATIGRVGAETLPRVAQLLAKTNQFNLTTRRHSAAELETMIAAGAVALWLRLADCFGDHGLVGVAVALERGGDWVVDTFLLSCRVIGRQAEAALLAQLAACVVQRGGLRLLGEYVATPRNGLVAEFYPQHGFASCGNGLWQLDLSRDTMSAPSHVEIHFHE